MSKRKKEEHDLDEDEEEEPNTRNQSRTQGSQKVYDFHKKTIEVYPERLRELNRQFSASISSQISNEPYSVLVGNCLDYVRQYFTYEDDLLQYSPWLATRLKKSRSDIVNCLQNTIDLYEALARQDFDVLFEKEPVSTVTSSKKLDDARPAVAESLKSTAPVSETSTSISFKTVSPVKTPAPFSFSIPSTGFSVPTFSSEKSMFSFPSSGFVSNPHPSSTPAASTEENDDEPSEPPQPEKVVHENDAKLTYNCRMGVSKDGKLTKRGPVQLVLKSSNDKSQLIIRSDDSLGRLFLNIIWSKLIELKKNSSKDLTFVCRLNPAMPEIAEGEFVTILLRFDSETDRNDAYEKLLKERS